MASSMDCDGSDGKSDNSDNTSAICGYKDVDHFSQVISFRCHLIATDVVCLTVIVAFRGPYALTCDCMNTGSV